MPPVELALGVSSDGEAVAEAELEGGNPAGAVAAARHAGVELLWLHANADLAPFGFIRRGGYVRMRAEAVEGGEPLPLLDAGDYAATIDLAYRGLWGHTQVAPDAVPPAGGTVVGLPGPTGPIGLCTVFSGGTARGRAGRPPGRRDPAGYARLLRGACVLLGPGPADLDSWGDAPDVLDAYARLGFARVEEVGGWELRLRC